MPIRVELNLSIHTRPLTGRSAVETTFTGSAEAIMWPLRFLAVLSFPSASTYNRMFSKTVGPHIRRKYGLALQKPRKLRLFSVICGTEEPSNALKTLEQSTESWLSVRPAQTGCSTVAERRRSTGRYAACWHADCGRVAFVFRRRNRRNDV